MTPSTRLPADARIGQVMLAVADLDRSIDYYTRVIGFEVHDRAAGLARLGAVGGGPVLLSLREQPGARPVPRRGRLGLFHFAILVPDRAALGRFVRHAGDLRVPLGMADHLVSEAVYPTDPDGLGIEVYVDRPRSEWKWSDQQVAMDSLPLDVAGVLAAGGTGPFTGLPMGTTIGHVHLHVGHLRAAERFYADALGFDVTVRGYPGALFLSAGGYHHHLGTNTWAAGAPPAGPDDARLLEWEILTTQRVDAEAALARLEAAGSPDGAAADSPAVTRTRDGGTAADPWGTVVRIRSQLGT